MRHKTTLACKHICATCILRMREAKPDRSAQTEEIEGKQNDLQGLREQATRQAQQLRTAREKLARVGAWSFLFQCDSRLMVLRLEVKMMQASCSVFVRKGHGLQANTVIMSALLEG